MRLGSLCATRMPRPPPPAAALIITKVMNLPFAWLPGPLLTAAAGAVAATVLLGLVGTFTALGQKPASVLRNL